VSFLFDTGMTRDGLLHKHGCPGGSPDGPSRHARNLRSRPRTPRVGAPVPGARGRLPATARARH
jgi:hypothetical protein